MTKRSAASPLCATPRCKNKKAVLYKKPDGSPVKANYCGSCRQRLWRERHPIEASYYNLKNRAKQRGIAFHLTRAEFKVWCEETGYHLLKAKCATGMSVDRIREHEPYQKGNLQMMTLSENSRKMHAMKGHKVLGYTVSNRAITNPAEIKDHGPGFEPFVPGPCDSTEEPW